MPRTYIPSKKKPYKKYSSDHIRAAIVEYESSNTSLKEIGKKYNISKSVLHRHITRHMRPHGRPRALKDETEQYLIKYINICSEWGYPLDTYDLRLLIKGYLDRLGVEIKRFKDNLPGPDFVDSFLKRHKHVICKRISQNIKRARAAVSPEIIEKYFNELQISLEGVPLCNIVNYDETNLSDDPGRKKIITKRGVKYPERVMNHSKASTSLMIAASADGTLLPGYVVYKAAHLYDTWTKNGPKMCRYNKTSSGWFDSNTFQDWVETVAFPYFEKMDGKKILIGDNLSSHLSIELIRKSKEKDIYFVFLPANSTHLTQPLDVAFFKPMKTAWRDILFNWKKTDGRTQASIPKNCFPQLLKSLFKRLETNVKNNILAGFSKTGISPLNKDKVLERLPGGTTRNETCTEEEKKAIDETVLNLLSEMRYGNGNTGNTSYSKKKKIKVQAGKSVGEDSDVDTDTSEITNKINDDDGEGDLDTDTEPHIIQHSTTRKTTKNKLKIIKKQESTSELTKEKIMNMPVVLGDTIPVSENITVTDNNCVTISNKDNSIPINENQIDNYNLGRHNFSEIITSNKTDTFKKPLPIYQFKKVRILSNETLKHTLNCGDLNKCKKVPVNTYINIPKKEKSNLDSGQINKTMPGSNVRQRYYKNDSEILKDLMDVDY